VVYTVSTNACAAANGGTHVNIPLFGVVSKTQIVATLPSIAAPAVKQDYKICVLNGATVMGSTTYTVYAAPVVSSISPASGSVFGGGTLAVVGTGFTRTSVVKVGGVLATGVSVAADGLSLTAKVPANAAATNAKVEVTTDGGVSGNTAADDYDYVSSVSVSPVTGDGTVGNVITVKGRGFDALVAGTAEVYVGEGAWLLTNTGTAVTSWHVVNDTTLVAVLPALATDGAYTVFVVTDDSANGNASVVSSSATYTVADF
jgi:hypothetical protein